MNIYKIILTFLNLRALKKENNAKINVSIHKCNEHNFNVINRNINLGQTESYTLYFIIWGGGGQLQPSVHLLSGSLSECRSCFAEPGNGL